MELMQGRYKKRTEHNVQNRRMSMSNEELLTAVVGGSKDPKTLTTPEREAVLKLINRRRQALMRAVKAYARLFQAHGYIAVTPSPILEQAFPKHVAPFCLPIAPNDDVGWLLYGHHEDFCAKRDKMAQLYKADQARRACAAAAPAAPAAECEEEERIERDSGLDSERVEQEMGGDGTADADGADRANDADDADKANDADGDAINDAADNDAINDTDDAINDTAINDAINDTDDAINDADAAINDTAHNDAAAHNDADAHNDAGDAGVARGAGDAEASDDAEDASDDTGRCLSTIVDSFWREDKLEDSNASSDGKEDFFEGGQARTLAEIVGDSQTDVL